MRRFNASSFSVFIGYEGDGMTNEPLEYPVSDAARWTHLRNSIRHGPFPGVVCSMLAPLSLLLPVSIHIVSDVSHCHCCLYVCASLTSVASTASTCCLLDDDASTHWGVPRWTNTIGHFLYRYMMLLIRFLDHFRRIYSISYMLLSAPVLPIIFVSMLAEPILYPKSGCGCMCGRALDGLISFCHLEIYGTDSCL